MYDITLELTENCLHNKVEKKSLQRCEELQRRKAMFYLPGETAMTLSIVEQIANSKSTASCKQKLNIEYFIANHLVYKINLSKFVTVIISVRRE